MSVFLTGGSGLIGGALARRLAERGDEPVALARSDAAERKLAELGARVVRDAQTINLALGYEMNTIEFAIRGDVPYAIDFLNPAPDFERDRITDFYFEMVVQRMAELVIDRARNGQPQQTWPRWAEMLGIGAAQPV